MLRITHYLPRIHLADGGVVRAVLDICQLLTEHDHRATLVTHDDADVPESWGDPASRRPTAVTTPPPIPLLGRFRGDGLAAIDRAVAQTDVLHLHTPWDPTNVHLAAIAKRHGVPYVLTTHGMLDDWSMAQRHLKKRAYLLIRGRRLLEGAARVHCTASAELDQARKWMPGAQAEVIPCIFDVSPFREPVGPERARQRFPLLEEDVPTVLFLSRLHHKKGAELLIEAAALVAERGHAFKLVMAGSGEDGYVQGLHRLVEKKGLTAITCFTGLVTGDDKISLYESADCFVLPTSQENFGLVFPEALAAATPVITTRGVDIWPELQGSGGALIVERDAPTIADAIIQLITDPERRAEMGRSGRAWVMETFASSQIVKQYEGMYERTLQQASAQAR